jgi:hypothetical protein
VRAIRRVAAEAERYRDRRRLPPEWRYSEDLADQLPAPRAERASLRPLALPRNEAGELQHCDVRAGEHQQRPCSAALLPVQSGARRDGIAGIDGIPGIVESATCRI